MGFEIEVKTGDGGPVVLRGCADGTVEFCKRVEVKDTKTGGVSSGLQPYKFYANIEQAFNRIFSMRVASSTASDIKELVAAIKIIREDIKREMGR